MSLSTRLTRPLLNAAVLISMAALWILFAPSQFGGNASYVMIAGASMEPELRWGDLVIAREFESYEIGDVVTYAHPIVGPVIHRVIDKSGNTYTLRGDNNAWIDSYTPVQEEIIGKAWLEIPSAAKILNTLRTPLGLSILSIGIGIMFLITVTSGKNQGSGINPVKKDKHAPDYKSLVTLADGWLFPLSTLLLASILLGIFAFTQPVIETVQVDIPYEHRGSFSYKAIGVSGVYDYGRIETGDPIFHSLTSSFEFKYAYAFTSTRETTSEGTYRLLLVISEPNGWHRQIELVPTREFSNGQFSLDVDIDLDPILSMIEELESRTGLKRALYDLYITPYVRSDASVAGHALFEQFSPSLHFKLDDYQLYLDGTVPFDEKTDPLNPIQIKHQPHLQVVPSSMSILGLDIQVETARWIASSMFLLSLLVLGYILYPIIKDWNKGPASKISWQYGDLLLDVDKLPKIKVADQINLTNFEDLAKLARSTKNLVLHQVAKDKHTYLLQTDEGTYRYILLDGHED